MSVKVHLLQRVAGPYGNFAAGRTIEVSADECQRLVDAKAAERIDGMRPYLSPESVVRSPEEEKAPKAKRETAVDKGAVKRETADEK